MEIEAFDHVVIRNPYIVDFLSTHKDNDSLLKACENVLELFCRSTCDFMDQHSKSSNAREELSGVVSYLQGFERRHSDYCMSVDARLNGIDVNVSNNVSNVSKEVIDIISREVSKMLLSTDSILSSAMSKLDVDNICLSVTASLQSWLEQFVQNNKDLSESVTHRLLDEVRNIPLLTKGVISDSLRQLEQQSHGVSISLNHAQQQLSNVHSDVRESISSLTCLKSNFSDKMDIIDKQLLSKSSIRSRGEVGENRLFDLLSERLMSREGYIVDIVSGKARNCDLVVKRDNYPTIRIESKAHGLHSGEKVRYGEVEKFQRDLLELNNHGIFVSLYSSIVGIGNLEIQQLPNGKFAVYLSNNNFDCDMILDMIHLLYKLDSITNQSDENDNLILSVESMMRVKDYIKDFNQRIQTVKAHMRESISVLNSVQLELIETLLLQNKDEDSSNVSDDASLVCHWCDKSFKSKQGLVGHEKRCKQRSSDN